MDFVPYQYFDQDFGIHVWAVFDRTSYVWYFPEKDTEEAARELAHKLNQI